MNGLAQRLRAAQQPLLYGHRGTRRRAVENTSQAFSLALAQGADGIELDVRPCRSGELVVCHDPELELPRGRRAVADCSLSELRQVDLGDGARMVTLDEAAAQILAAGRLLNVEAKADVPDRDRLMQPLVDFAAGLDEPGRSSVFFSSFEPAVVAALCAQTPLAVAQLVGPGSCELFDTRAHGVHPHSNDVDRESLAQARGRGRFVNVWTVNDPQRARELSALGVHGIITDDIPLLRDALSL